MLRARLLALVRAARDPDDEVRNNATRALGVLVRSNRALAASIPPDTFIEMLNSGTWSDRNKAGMLLMEMTASRGSDLLGKIRSMALDPLIEMASWRRPHHALFARMVLGRVAEIPEDRLKELAWNGRWMQSSKPHRGTYKLQGFGKPMRVRSVSRAERTGLGAGRSDGFCAAVAVGCWRLFFPGRCHPVAEAGFPAAPRMHGLCLLRLRRWTGVSLPVTRLSTNSSGLPRSVRAVARSQCPIWRLLANMDTVERVSLDVIGTVSPHRSQNGGGSIPSARK